MGWNRVGGVGEGPEKQHISLHSRLHGSEPGGAQQPDPFHLVANQPCAASADSGVELHTGLFQAGLTLLPEGHHGVIAHPLRRLQLHF